MVWFYPLQDVLSNFVIGLAHAVYNKYIEVCRSSNDWCHKEAFESGLNFWFVSSPAIGSGIDC